MEDNFETKKLKGIKQKSKKVKAAGLKSTFVIEDEILMTAFGKGNEAIPEKEIKNGEIKTISTDAKFTVKDIDKNFNVTGRGITSSTTNPLVSTKTTGEDLIGCKNALEKKYFGKTYNDNIHIQLIYNILDIEKIMAIHINNIIYALDNLQNRDEIEYGDFIGYMSTRNTYDVFCNYEEHFKKDSQIFNNLKKQKWQFDKYKESERLRYFGTTFYKEKASKGGKTKYVLDEKKMYYLFAILGDVRQFCAHSRKSLEHSLYDMDNFLSKEAKEYLDEMYNTEIATLNNNFIRNNSKNIGFLCEILNISGDNAKKELIAKFYDYIVKKSFKNIGFSVKKLRENMIIQNVPELKSQKFDSVRSKLCTLLDYIIYNYYTDKKIEDNVNTLRACLTDEEKEKFYEQEANILWTTLKTKVENLKNKMNGPYIDKYKIKYELKELIKETVAEIAIDSSTDYFCKVIYLITRFLDGKEINDLLTTLINKFDNIASFISVMSNRNIEYSFDNRYKLFERSEEICQSLREINSFARMIKMQDDAKRILYIDAAEILGTDLSEEELVAYLDENVLSKNLGRGKHGFRNFIASNVIESSRFKYLVRYANPKKVRAVANNRKVVRFVLERIPETQIDRYCESCFGKVPSDYDIKIQDLTDIITGISFKDFENVNQSAKVGTFEGKDKQQKQAVISLYLTVLYHLTKNLVYVNSRYFLAFHCLERDAQLHKSDAGYERKNWCALTKTHLTNREKEINKRFNAISEPNRNQKNRKWKAERSIAYLGENISHIDDKTITLYRNNVSHLNPVRNINRFIGDAKEFKTYFELYHYLMQRTIAATSEEFLERPLMPVVQKYCDFATQKGIYCKDFVKALNVPFGYNLPRFKNLSIDALFDMHNPPVVEKDGK